MAAKKKRKSLKPGTKVSWNTSQGKTTGKVVKRTTKVGKIKGHKVAASAENPEYLVETDDGKRAAADEHAPRGHRARDADRAPAPVEERDVDREPHAERVDRAAVRDQQRVSRRQIAQQRDPEQSRGERARLVDDRIAGDGEPRESLEPTREHARIRAPGKDLSPRLDCHVAADVAQLARAPLS